MSDAMIECEVSRMNHQGREVFRMIFFFVGFVSFMVV